MEAVITSIGGKAGELAFDLIKHEITYMLSYKTNVDNLKEVVDDLRDARQRVHQSVDAAKKQGRKIFKDVDRWLTMVDHKISEMAETKLKEDEEKANERCFIGLCPNFKSRYLLSKRAEEEANTIAQLLEKGRFDTVSYRPAHANGSTTSALNRVMEALKNDNSTVVGLYGARRASMTALVKEVARVAKGELFDKVVIATISLTPNIEKIQREIAENSGEKVLIILDDIRVTLELEALGIPTRGENMRCKILLTSRKLNVLSSMGVQNPFAISVFNKEEAWNLFKNMAGDIVERYDLEVAQKCGELPIVIATFAETLKNKKALFELNNALQELKTPFLRSLKRNLGLGDAYSVDVAKGWVWPDSGQVDFVFGSIRILVDFKLGSFHVRVMPGSNHFELDLFQIQIMFKSGLFQVWMKPNSDQLKF